MILLLTQELPQDVTPANQIIQLLLRETTLSNKTLQPLKLLLRVSRVLASLLKHLGIVLCVLVLKRAGQLLRLLDAIGPCALELLDDCVESIDSAASRVETAAGSAVGACVCVEEVDEVLLGAGALVGEGLAAALLEVLDGGVGLDALVLCESFGVLGFGIDLCDEDGGLSGEVVGEGLPDGSKRLAVYTILAMQL